MSLPPSLSIRNTTTLSESSFAAKRYFPEGSIPNPRGVLTAV
jgi:hypothetical protein